MGLDPQEFQKKINGEHFESFFCKDNTVELVPASEVAQFILERTGVAETVVPHEEPDNRYVEVSDGSDVWISAALLGPEEARKVQRQLAVALAGAG